MIGAGSVIGGNVSSRSVARLAGDGRPARLRVRKPGEGELLDESMNVHWDLWAVMSHSSMGIRSGPGGVGLALLLGLLALALASPVLAAGDEEPFAYDLAGELMSPFCGADARVLPEPANRGADPEDGGPGAAGASREEGVAMLVDEFGEEILGAPPARRILGFVFPVAGFLAFGLVAVLVLRRIVGGPPSPANAGVIDVAPVDPIVQARARAVPTRPSPSAGIAPDDPGVEDDELARSSTPRSRVAPDQFATRRPRGRRRRRRLWCGA
ncbi:MAG: hypothetical protein R3E53_14400 [Myxococcota bacterium]